MTADYAYKFLQFMARKNQVNQIKPAEFNFAMTQAQLEYYDSLVGIVQGFQNNKPTPRVGVGMNIKIDEALAPFKVNDLSVTVAANIAPYPPNYNYLALMTDVNGKRIEYIADNKLPGRLNSKIDPPSDTGKSWYTVANTGWKIYPAGTNSSVNVTFYTNPQPIVWGFTLDVNGRPVYNPGTSTDPQFSDVELENEVLPRAAKYLGFSFQSQNLVEYGKDVLND